MKKYLNLYTFKDCWFLLIGINLAFTIFLFYQHYQSITYPFSLEVKEGATYQITNALLRGINPYSFENHISYYNSYGILYNVIVYPFAWLLGNSLILHRAINGFFIFINCYGLFYTLRKHKTSFIVTWQIVLIFYATSLYFSNASVRPDQLGTFLFIYSLLIPFIKNFSRGSLIISALLSILAFYTKAYFIMGFPLVLLYIILFESKRKAIISGIIYLIVFVLIAFIVFKRFPLYFYNTIFSYGTSEQVSWKFSIQQFISFFFKNLGLTLLLVYVILVLRTQMVRSIKKVFRSSISIMKFDQPLLINSIRNYFVYISFCIITILVCILGRNKGAWLTYYYQLFLPFYLISVVYFLSKAHIPKVVISLLLYGNLILNIYYISNMNYCLDGWEKVSKLAQEYSSVYCDQSMVPVFSDKNKEIFDSGHSLFIVSTHENKLADLLFDIDRKVIASNKKYLADLTNKLGKNYFDLLILRDDGYSPLIGFQATKFYSKVDSLNLCVPQQGKLQFSLWVPKKTMINSE